MADDFRISRVKNQDLMTVLHNENGQGVIIKPTYGVRNAVRLGDPRTLNIHEFHFVGNGSRALVIKSNKTTATIDDCRSVGIAAPCTAEFDGFEEFETETWQSVFSWTSLGRIGLNESTRDDGTTIESRCSSGWDFLHVNSVDKCADWDYLMSARFTDTIYKISHLDGSIVWRLGGTNSDFDMAGLTFSGQHSVRHVSSTNTQTVISILDNAIKDEIQPTHTHSRGLLLKLNTSSWPMTVTKLAEYQHPHGEGAYAHARGNYQTLDSGNVLIGWSKQAIQSEHTADGKLVMDAQLVPEWLGSYRNYKFPFVGQPREKIYVVARSEQHNGKASTAVWVSWNGATEVVEWHCYKHDVSASEASNEELIASAKKIGVETQLRTDGHVESVVVKAIDRDGTILGSSRVAKVQQAGDNWSHVKEAVPALGQQHPSALLMVSMCWSLLIYLAWRKCWLQRARRCDFSRYVMAISPMLAAESEPDASNSVRRHRLYT
ncbi:Putative arylsulfotransferase [Septoria linicola]|uniref:Arylsulfotransferase n=1 Tax=Septoria linicola TaxID=215465 RepID=A0A9Q9APL6_9PEZI|nr:putative arylsulfotransferase [Septoria linicola]USW49752.1 Putative arylsulfotransferase [Septoria linicola]